MLARRPTWPLYQLERAFLGENRGVRAARWIGILLGSLLFTALIVLARRFGPDAVLATTARGAAAIAASAGTLAALALAQAPRRGDASLALSALARSRGFADEAIARSSVLASAGLVLEIVAVPIALAEALSLLLAPKAAVSSPGAPFGITLFGVVVSVLLGLLAAACRRWGKTRGRALLLVIVIVPWFVSSAFTRGPLAHASIPDLLCLTWAALTGAAS